MKQKMSDLKNIGRFRRAAVLGGGPSLPADMEKLPQGVLLIAVNYHALRVCEPHYMVYNDDPESDPKLLEAVRTTEAVKVSPHSSSDVEFDVPVWTGHYSSNAAAWLGLWMGCCPVILCGMDLYQGEQKYFYPVEGDKPLYHYPLEHHLRPWIEEAHNLCPHPQRLRAMSGPLVEVFGGFHDDELI